MNLQDVLLHLSNIDGSKEITLSPGPFSRKIGSCDAFAAKMLLWMFDELPDSATVGDMLDILSSAEWWLTLHLSQLPDDVE